MSRRDLVSIIVPAYKVEKELLRCEAVILVSFVKKFQYILEKYTLFKEER